MGLGSQTIYFNSKQEIMWFPLQINPPESNELFHTSLLRFYTLLEAFILDDSQFCRSDPLVISYKYVSMNDVKFEKS